MNTEYRRRLSDGPSAIIGWASASSDRSSLDEGYDKLYRALHLLAVIERVSGTGISPCVSSLSGSLFPIEIRLYILVPSNTQMARPTRVSVGCAHSVKA